MKHYWYLLLFFVFAFLFFPPFRNSPNASIVLNEIFPAPSSGEFEWVELYNTEDKNIDISQYQLLDLDGHKIKIATDSAPPFSYVLATSSAVLNNTGDSVLLKNNVGEILEVATYSGTFDSTKTFAKCPDGGNNWFSLNLITKNGSNGTACFSLTPTPVLTSTIAPTETPLSTIIPTNSPLITPFPDYASVFISEVYPYPNKNEDEWVELFNANDSEVVLTNWKIDDIENGGSSPHSFNLTIPAKQYKTVSFSSSLFNNSGDSVRLLNSSGIEKDSMEYTGAKQGLSFGREDLNSDTYCLQSPSPNATNNACNEEIQTQKQTLSTQTKTKTGTTSTGKTLSTVVPALISIKNTSSTYVQETSPEVLGETTRLSSQSSSPSLSPYLSIVSTSYALLTLVSVFVKMRYANNS